MKAKTCAFDECKNNRVSKYHSYCLEHRREVANRSARKRYIHHPKPKSPPRQIKGVCRKCGAGEVVSMYNDLDPDTIHRTCQACGYTVYRKRPDQGFRSRRKNLSSALQAIRNVGEKQTTK